MGRMPGDAKVLGPSWAIATVAEGRVWVTRNAFRFPAEFIATKRTDDFGPYLCRLPLEDHSAFETGQVPRFSFRNEKDQLNQTLMRATERKGLTDSTPIRPEIPDGWMVPEDDDPLD